MSYSREIMRSLALLLLVSTLLVSNVIAEKEMADKDMMALLKAYQRVVDKVTKDLLELEEEEEKILGDDGLHTVERDVDSPLGL